MNTFKTETFSCPTGQYMRTITGMWLWRWWWLLLIPLCVSGYMAITLDVAFAFAALMIIFIIYPTILMIVFFAYVTTPEALIATRSKTFSLDDNGITINFVEIKIDDEHSQTLPPRFISWDEVTRYELIGKGIRLFLTGSRYRFIEIPYPAIPDIDSTTELISLLNTQRQEKTRDNP